MALSSWVDCLVSIRFDLDIGPKIEFISPPNAITEEGKIKLLHCAFPDCNPDCGYNFIFYFTMPDCTTVAAQSFSQTVAPPTTGNTVPELYGAAFYRQKHDPKVPRRYVQQVVVLLSHLPYYNVHELILRVVAPRFCQCCPLSPDTGKVAVSSVLSPVPESYFEVDQSFTAEHYSQDDVLRDAMEELAQWPSPHPQVRYTVNLLQQALVFLTPAHSLRQSIRATRSSCAAVRKAMTVDDRVEFVEVARGNSRYRGSAFGNDVLPLFSLLGEQLHHLTYVWELVLRHEPLFILSNTPCVASATAFSIASLILPIQFNGTLRSYFTVQNEDFSRLSRMGKALPFPTNEALIVAGTNPFLLRGFSGWPSLLVVMDRNTAHVVNGSVAAPAASATRDTNASGLGGSGLGSPLPPQKASQHLPSRAVPMEELHASSALPLTNNSNLASPSTVGVDVKFSGAASFGESIGSSQRSSKNAAGEGDRAVARGSSSSASHSTSAPVAPGRTLYRFPESTNTHVTMVPSSTGSGVSLSALVRTPAAKVGNDTAAVSVATTAYHADPHAAYALESSSGSSPSSSSSPLSLCAASTASEGDEHLTGGAASASPTSSTGVHDRVSSTQSAATCGAGSSTSLLAAPSASSRLSSSPSAAQTTMPALSASSVSLFTMEHYKATLESVHTADYRKRGGGHQEMSRTNLQQRLHNYFDSSVHFLLNHAEQSSMLLKRLEMVSLLDADAQRTSVTLSLNQWQGSPTSVSTTWRHGSGGGAPATSSSPAFPSAPSAAAAGQTNEARPATPQRHGDPTSMENGVTACSHFSVADDILRKFFTSLTTEFLTPVTAWYAKVTAPYTAFHLCDRALCDNLLSPVSFLNDFTQRHRETAPLMWTQLHSFKTYKVVYERFANGCLFKAYVCQLIDEDLRRQLEAFQIEDWVVRVPSEAERIDLLIGLLSTIQRELNETLDPDVLFVTSATSVMASMAVGLREPHREQFMLKIGELKL